LCRTKLKVIGIVGRFLQYDAVPSDNQREANMQVAKCATVLTCPDSG
jgi:hypothetical protein